MNVGVNSFTSVLSSLDLVGMRSGPVALCSLSEDSDLCMPFGVIQTNTLGTHTLTLTLSAVDIIIIDEIQIRKWKLLEAYSPA